MERDHLITIVVAPRPLAAAGKNEPDLVDRTMTTCPGGGCLLTRGGKVIESHGVAPLGASSKGQAFSASSNRLLTCAVIRTSP